MLQISKNLTRMRTTKRERESEFDIEDEDKPIQEEEKGRDGGTLLMSLILLSYRLFVAVKRMRRLHWIGYRMLPKWRNQRSQGGDSWNRH